MSAGRPDNVQAKPPKEGQPKAIQLEAGEVLSARYTVARFLGAGGFAAVYEAYDQLLDRRVAVKVLNTLSLAHDPQQLRQALLRFQNEGRAAARIKHPSVVSIYDLGVVEAFSQPFLVMELLEGCDLRQAVLDDGLFTVARVQRLFDPVIEALGAAHKLGIIHKDLNLSNLYLNHPNTPHEALRIVDFGIARLQSGKAVTHSGLFFGTPNYIAPEYVVQQQVSPAIDIYQIGLILAETLTGRRAVQSENPMTCLFMHTRGELDFDEGLLQSPLGPVIRRATALNPKDRYPDAASLRAALAAVDPEACEPFLAEARHAWDDMGSTEGWAEERMSPSQELEDPDAMLAALGFDGGGEASFTSGQGMAPPSLFSISDTPSQPSVAARSSHPTPPALPVGPPPILLAPPAAQPSPRTKSADSLPTVQTPPRASGLTPAPSARVATPSSPMRAKYSAGTHPTGPTHVGVVPVRGDELQGQPPGEPAALPPTRRPTVRSSDLAPPVPVAASSREATRANVPAMPSEDGPRVAAWAPLLVALVGVAILAVGGLGLGAWIFGVTDATEGPHAGKADAGLSPATPDAGVAAPDVGVAAPDVGVAAPDVGGAVPDVGGAVPDAGVVTPDAGVVTPDAGAGPKDAPPKDAPPKDAPPKDAPPPKDVKPPKDAKPPKDDKTPKDGKPPKDPKGKGTKIILVD